MNTSASVAFVINAKLTTMPMIRIVSGKRYTPRRRTSATVTPLADLRDERPTTKIVIGMKISAMPVSMLVSRVRTGMGVRAVMLSPYRITTKTEARTNATAATDSADGK